MPDNLAMSPHTQSLYPGGGLVAPGKSLACQEQRSHAQLSVTHPTKHICLLILSWADGIQE